MLNVRWETGMKDAFDYQVELLWKEIDLLQQSIRTYYTMLMTIKSWAITVFSAFVIFAVKEKQPQNLLLCALAVLLFWVLDALFKSFQRAFIIRYNKVEHVLRKDLPTAVEKRSFKNLLVIPDIRGRLSFSSEERRDKTTPLKGALYPHTSLLYVAMIVFDAVLYFTMS
jgi:hypothetical protein